MLSWQPNHLVKKLTDAVISCNRNAIIEAAREALRASVDSLDL